MTETKVFNKEEHADLLAASIKADKIAIAALGDDYLTAFDAAMTRLGFAYTGALCFCADPNNGHDPACGWSRV